MPRKEALWRSLDVGACCIKAYDVLLTLDSLTWHSCRRRFKGFHERYYHPSNARFWFYGDDDPEERLRILARLPGRVRRAPGRQRHHPAAPLHRGRPIPLIMFPHGALAPSMLLGKCRLPCFNPSPKRLHILLQICAAAACDTWAVDGLELMSLLLTINSCAGSDIPKW